MAACKRACLYPLTSVLNNQSGCKFSGQCIRYNFRRPPFTCPSINRISFFLIRVWFSLSSHRIHYTKLEKPTFRISNQTKFHLSDSACFCLLETSICQYIIGYIRLCNVQINCYEIQIDSSFIHPFSLLVLKTKLSKRCIL